MTNQLSQEKKTKKTFRDKWVNNPDLAFSQTLDSKSEIFKWILNRNGFKKPEDLQKYLKSKKRVLDAGCGNGRVTALLRKYSDPKTTEVVGVDVAPIEIARGNLKKYKLDQNTNFSQADLMKSLKKLGQFDFIYSQEVLHHTKNPQKAFNNLVEILSPKGEIAIYVYKKKAPIREFVDDYIRERISKLPYNQAMKVCREITELGKVLSETKTKIKVPKVEILEIDGGALDLQRFIYHYFMKCFWNPDLSFEANTAINFDWYHPQICARYDLEEIKEWFKAADLKITQTCVDHYGITVRGKK
jgi:SAM-dependent methyltransferase